MNNLLRLGILPILNENDVISTVCADVFACVCMRVLTLVCACVYVCAYTGVHVCVCVRVPVCMRICIACSCVSVRETSISA